MVDGESRSIERVRVAVRVRPRNHREEGLDSASKILHSIDVDDTTGQIYVCKNKKPERSAVPQPATASSHATEPVVDRELRCSYDRVFAPSATQEDVFDYVRDAVQQVAQGFNCTIFAYGQTGTGKTHTMLGQGLERYGGVADEATMATTGQQSQGEWGVIPRSIQSLFAELQSIAHHGAAAAIVHCSYMQIYNNEVYDLLQENKSRMREPLTVREMIKGNDKQIYVSGLSEFRVTGLEETLRLLRQGNKNRTIRATEYNEKSSRSHALLQLSAEVESRGVEGPTTIIRRAKLNLVDLAGSEKWDTDVSMGSDRCKELTSINQSLSALGNVISALANPRRTHVPYRDAKLTRLLQDSLGGNTRTTVIATISQDESAIDETISTLLFADRAKCVTLRVKANEMVDDAVLLAQARREIARLKLLVKKNVSQDQINELEQTVAKLTQENASLTMENKKLKQAMAVMKKDKAEKDKTLAAATTSVATNSGIVAPAQKLRLEIESQQTSGVPKTPPSRSTTAGMVNKTSHQSQVGGGVSRDEEQDQAAAVVKAEHDQSRLLEQIQSERRALEKELERIQLQQTPRKARTEESDARGTMGNNNNSVDAARGQQEEEEETCPICGRLIDDHSDEELDVCIEQETVAMKEQQQINRGPVSRAPSRARTPQSQAPRPSSSHQQISARTPPPARRLSTPRGGDASRPSSNTNSSSSSSNSSSNRKPASPYSQELFVHQPQAPSSPPPLVSSSSASTRQQPSLQAALQLGSAQRRSVRDLAKARSLDGNSGHIDGSGSARDDADQPSGPSRPLTADPAHKMIQSSSNNNNSSNDHADQSDPAVRLLNVPIVHQGSKSVKALKKFQASSPYSKASSKRQLGSTSSSSSPPRKSPVSKGGNQSTGAATGSEMAVLTGSHRDIGVSLMIYKFRYDCWYPCTVVGYDAKRRLHCCQYEYGDKQWQELSQHKIKLVATNGE